MNLLRNSFTLLLCVAAGYFVYDHFYSEPVIHFDSSHVADVARVDISERRKTVANIVYIGSGNCVYCTKISTKENIRHIIQKFRDYSDSSDTDLISTGISVDKYPNTGILHLSDIRVFDQVISGAGIFNLGAYTTSWKFSAEARTPQVVLLISEYDIIPHAQDRLNLKRDQRVVKRVIGTQSIDNFESSLDPEYMSKLLK